MVIIQPDFQLAIDDNHCVMLAFNDKYGPRGNPCVHVAGDIAHYLILLYLQCNTNRTIL